MGFGINFVPGQDEQQKPQGVGGGPQVSPVQQAIRTISLRLPRVGGAQAMAPGAIAPNALMGAPGGGGLAGMDDMTLEQLLLRLFGGGPMGMPTGGPGGPPPSRPPPHIIPGGVPPSAPPPSGGPSLPTWPAPTIDRTTPAPETPGTYTPGPYTPSPLPMDMSALLDRLGRGGGGRY